MDFEEYLNKVLKEDKKLAKEFKKLHPEYEKIIEELKQIVKLESGIEVDNND